jgi:hypothetical protein
LNRDGLFRIALDGLCGTAVDAIGELLGFSCCRINFFQLVTASTSLKTCAATSLAVCCIRAFAALTEPGFRPAPGRLPPRIYASISPLISLIV